MAADGCDAAKHCVWLNTMESAQGLCPVSEPELASEYCLACSVWHLSVNILASCLAAQQFSLKILDVTLVKLCMCLAEHI